MNASHRGGNPYVLGEFNGGSVFYISMIASSKATNQVALFYDGMGDIELVEDISTTMRHKTDNTGPYYKINLPGTSAYAWMRVTFESRKGLSLFVKNGKRPTKLDYDWLYTHPRDRDDDFYTSWDINAIDENFNGGYFYFWFTLHDTSSVFYDYIRISMISWSPLYI